MTERRAHTIYAATSVAATALLSFLAVSLVIGRLSAAFDLLVFLLAAAIWLAGFALRHVVTR